MIVDVHSHAWRYPQDFTDARKNMVECLTREKARMAAAQFEKPCL
jgi:hypothetical protein